MSEIEIYWLGLRNDRERTIFVEAFWHGINSTDNLRKQVIKCETDWLVGRSGIKEQVYTVAAEVAKINGVVG